MVHTVSRVQDLRDLRERQPGARFVLELVHQHAAPRPVRRATCAGPRRTWARSTAARFRGIALHLPLASGSHLAEVHRLVDEVVGAGLADRRTTIWVSHLTDDELGRLRTTHADFEIRPRIGTHLWLGDRGALRVTATVLDVHPVERGDVFGYRGRSAPKSGHVVVVSGGPPTASVSRRRPATPRSRPARPPSPAAASTRSGFVRSPFTIDGKQRLFAEPPHMQASMLFLPSGAHVPAVGDQVDVRVRYTATTFDRVDIVG